MNQPKKTERIQELDALRGLAALGVVLYHYTYNYNDLWGHPEDFRLSFPWGAFGVELFFVISGFVILMTLEQSKNIGKFVWNRFSRLYPAYWASMLLTFIVVSLLGLPGRERSLFDLAVNTTMCQGFFGVANVDGPYWTLHVELCFYLLMAVLFAIGVQKQLLTILAVLAVLGLVNSIGRVGSEWPGVWQLERAWPLRHFLPWFFYGVVLYRARHEGLKRHAAWLALAIGLALVCRPHRMAVVVIGLMALSTQTRLPLLCVRPLLFLGTISYALYLVHANVGYALIYRLQGSGVPPLAAVTIALALALILAVVITLCIERPAHRWLRRRLSPRRESVTDSSAEETAGVVA